MSSKYLKQSAASARRAATMVDDLAKRCHDEADRGVMIAAARIAGRMANDLKKQAADEKQKEVAYEKRQKAALTTAKQVVDQWPMDTVLQRVALIVFSGGGHMMRNLLEYLTTYHGMTAERRLASYFEDAANETANEISYAVAKNLTAVEVEANIRREKLNKTTEDVRVIELAKSVEALIEEQRARIAA